MAKAAQRARVPYTLSVAGGATIEQAAEAAPDVFWLQLYRFWHDDHKIGLDLVRRAQAVEAKVLTLTLDVPVRTTRSRETYAGLAHEFRPNPRMICEMMVRPQWMLALLRHGYPRFATIADYAPPGAWTNEIIAFARARMGGAFSWEEVKRYRDAWKGPMAVKGVLHPEDAAKAVSLGIDGIWVSNHGGRQIEALMPSIDVLPAIVAEVGKKATIVLDSGIRSGQDVMRALALGADAAFAGKSFLWAVAALGDDGPDYLIDLYIDELRASLGQIGARSIAEAREGQHPPSRGGDVRGDPAGRSRGPASGRPRSILPCTGGSGGFRGSPLQGAASGSPFNVGDCRIVPHIKPDDTLARRNAMVLAVAQALAGGNNTVIVSTASIVGAVLAPDKGLATLPITAMVFGMWLGTLPVGLLARRFGRRFALQTGSAFGVLSGLISYSAVMNGSFWAAAHRHVLRRALCGRAPVLPLRRGRYRERSLPSEGRVVGAGGRRVRRRARAAARHLHQGSAVAASVRRELSRPVGLRDRWPRSCCNSSRCRRSARRALQWRTAALGDRAARRASSLPWRAAMASYAMMNMVMTSAPLAMVGCGHSVTDAALGIQWHVLAMYAPSFFTGSLIARFGVERITGIGLALIVATAVVGISGITVAHFWTALVLLGLGWNLSFIGATTMVTQCHRPQERNKVQAFNDFLIFGSMAIGSFSSGQMLAKFGWTSINEVIFPTIFVTAALLLWLSFRPRASTV